MYIQARRLPRFSHRVLSQSGEWRDCKCPAEEDHTYLQLKDFYAWEDLLEPAEYKREYERREEVLWQQLPVEEQRERVLMAMDDHVRHLREQHRIVPYSDPQQEERDQQLLALRETLKPKSKVQLLKDWIKRFF